MRVFLAMLAILWATSATADSTRLKYQHLCEFGRTWALKMECHATTIKSMTDAELESAMIAAIAGRGGEKFDAAFNRWRREIHPEVFVKRKKLPSREALEAVNTGAVCAAWRNGSRDAMAILDERAAFGRADLQSIRTKTVRIGMEAGALRCAWGSPDSRNRTVTASGESVQLVYGDTLVYVDNGFVTAFQD